MRKIKGIIARPMPAYWFNMKACGGDKFLQNICVEKKPYFMTYVYEDYGKEYKQYLSDREKNCLINFGCTVNELRLKDNLTDEEQLFIFWYDFKMPFGLGNCAMNKICWYVENAFKDYKINLKHSTEFNYNTLKTKRRCSESHRSALYDLSQEYVALIANYKSHVNDGNNVDKETRIEQRIYLQKVFRDRAEELCPNEDERLNIVLDLCYGTKNNRQFCWDCVGDLIVKRLEQMEDNKNVCNA